MEGGLRGIRSSFYFTTRLACMFPDEGWGTFENPHIPTFSAVSSQVCATANSPVAVQRCLSTH